MTDLRRSLVSVRDSTPAGIVGADLDGDAVARKNADVELPHPAADRREHDERVVALDAEHRVRQRLLDDAVEFELVALRLFALTTFTHSSS